MKRSKFNLGYTKLLTLNMGNLVPVGLLEVLPGDSIQMSTAALVRASPLVAPIMHPVDVRIHHWFVPNRLVWNGQGSNGWEGFITGGTDGLAAPTMPTRTPGNSAAVGSLADYMGVPTGVGNVEINGLPFRGYQYIWNEWYRDQDLQAQAVWSGGNGPDALTNTTLQSICWEKDYYTSARPWEQKGPAITIPIGSSAPVNILEGSSGRTVVRPGSGGANPLNVVEPGSAGAELKWQADLTTASGITVNALRQSLALQRFEEARARYGSRYPEYLAFLGIKSSDGRLDRPEFLGGGRQRIQFSEVLQTAADGGGTPTPVGTLRGHGITAMRSNRFRRFFEEHGYIHTLMSVRPKTIYMNGLPRHFQRKVKTDYWQRELEHIGQQQVLLNEVFMSGGAAGKAVFGYSDRYDEYRRSESQVSGEFRTISNFWHMARDFASAPALNSSFVACVPTTRPFAVTSAHQLMVQCKHSIVARRLLSQSGTSVTF
ncbi:major capsid protein [Blackfly microvirus SF02]|uniref:Major capsid protein n=1 Tax=Blackfly microvirus SF02 TaxID=2576452 RepID=A0A4P8PKI3_9VIRU|nr:major capsid protein [Blackfly microvirus SF02]